MKKALIRAFFLYAFCQQKQKIWECLSDLTEKTQSVLFTVVFYCNKIRYRLKNIVLCRVETERKDALCIRTQQEDNNLFRQNHFA